MNFSKKNTALFLVGVVCIGIILFLFLSNKEKEINVIIQNDEVSFAFEKTNENNLVSFSGFVQPSEEVLITPQVVGVVKDIFVTEGQDVKDGQEIIQIENINQRLSLKNAQVSYEAAKLQLEKMKGSNSKDDPNSNISRVSKTQNSLVESARNSYINADLRAYPVDFDEDKSAPIISGNYTCEPEGEYLVEVYSSNGPEGASFRLKGLETDTQSISVNYPVLLGDCGLEIVFPSDFSTSTDWVIPVPNTRSSHSVQSKNQYEVILSGKQLAVKQGTIDIKDIKYQEKLVSQAALGIEVALVALAKTTIVSPVNGKIEELYIDRGGVVSSNSNIGRITSKDFEFITEVPLYQRAQLFVGQEGEVLIGNEKYKVVISSFVDNSDSLNQGKKVKFSFKEEVVFIGGEIGEVKLALDHFFQKIPREFVGFGYEGSFVYCDGQQRLVRIYEEDETFYWVDFKNNTCTKNLLLPHLIS